LLWAVAAAQLKHGSHLQSARTELGFQSLKHSSSNNAVPNEA